MFTVMSDDACCYGNREEKYSLVHLFHKNMKHFSSDERITSMMCAIALFSPDREGLVEHKKIEKFQHYFTCVLQNYIQGAKKEKISTFAVSDYKMKIENLVLILFSADLDKYLEFDSVIK